VALSLLIAGAALAQERPACFNPFPVFDPQHPGACFQNTDLGVILNLETEDSCLQVETFGETDDFLRWEPNGGIHSHQSELQALFKYCPPEDTECTCSFFLPSEGGWLGAGQFYVNAQLDPFFNFTCPTAIVGHGVTVDPDNGDRYAVRVRMIFVPQGQNNCRRVANEIEVTPLDE
jgi:hypothetical protein